MKSIIKYKKEGDGFIVDFWTEDRYTFSFYFHNELPPVKYKGLGLPTLYKRCLAIYDSLLHKHYSC